MKKRRRSKKGHRFLWASRESKGIKGFHNDWQLDDTQKAVNISLWETKEDMDNYYANDKSYA